MRAPRTCLTRNGTLSLFFAASRSAYVENPGDASNPKNPATAPAKPNRPYAAGPRARTTRGNTISGIALLSRSSKTNATELLTMRARLTAGGGDCSLINCAVALMAQLFSGGEG